MNKTNPYWAAFYDMRKCGLDTHVFVFHNFLIMEAEIIGKFLELPEAKKGYKRTKAPKPSAPKIKKDRQRKARERASKVSLTLYLRNRHLTEIKYEKEQ